MELTKSEVGGFGVSWAQAFDQKMKFAEVICRSDFCPREFKGKPENVVLAIIMGEEIGLKPLQALQNISVINGRPSVWGEAATALIRTSPDFLSLEEFFEGSSPESDDWTAVCILTLKNQPPIRRTFSIKDARRAGLWGKAGAWTTYGPNRMLAARAKGFCFKDGKPEALKGLILREEALDYPAEKEVQGTARVVDIHGAGEHLAPQKISQINFLPLETNMCWKKLVEASFDGEEKLKEVWAKETPREYKQHVIENHKEEWDNLKEVAIKNSVEGEILSIPITNNPDAIANDNDWPVSEDSSVGEEASFSEELSDEHDDFLKGLD